MWIEKEKNTIIIRPKTEDITYFFEIWMQRYKDFENSNLLFILPSEKKLPADILAKFLQLSKKHRRHHSLVIATKNAHMEEFSKELMVVPTRQEGLDLIEIEEIERDLNF